MLENGVQLTPASTSNSTGKTRNNGKELNGSASTEEEEKRQGNAGDAQPPASTCTTCAKGHTCQAVVSRTREMRSLIDAKKSHQAQALFGHLADEGHRPSLVTYTTLLTAVTNQRAFEAIPSLLAGIDAAGLRPDAIFFNALINSFVEAGRMGEATSTFWKMSRHHPGCRPTISTFNTLIKGFGIAGRPDESQRIFDMMAGGDGHGDGAGVASTVRPNLTTYNILVKAWCDHRRLEEAWGVVGRMRARGVEPDVVTYNTVASAYAKNDETWRAEELVVEMVRARLRTSERTWGIIVGGYCREGRLEEALRCVRQMKDAGVLPNVIVFNTLLKGFLDANDTAAADDVLGLMEQFGIKPDIVTYSHQLNAFSSLGHMAKCSKVFDRMVEAGIEPDPQVYSILAKGHVRAQQPGKAEELLERMRRLGVRPNVVTFTTVISGWCSVADMDNAARVYRKMRDAGVRPNLRTFETLIWGYSEQKQPWKAEEVLQMMQEAGVRPKQSTYSLVADAWKAVGLVKNANRTLGSPEDRRRPTPNASDHDEPDRRPDDDKLQRSGRASEQATSDPSSHASFVQVTSAVGIGRAGDFASSAPSLSSSPWRSCQLRLRSSGFCRNQRQKQCGLHSHTISSIKMVFLS